MLDFYLQNIALSILFSGAPILLLFAIGLTLFRKSIHPSSYKILMGFLAAMSALLVIVAIMGTTNQPRYNPEDVAIQRTPSEGDAQIQNISPETPSFEERLRESRETFTKENIPYE